VGRLKPPGTEIYYWAFYFKVLKLLQLYQMSVLLGGKRGEVAYIT